MTSKRPNKSERPRPASEALAVGRRSHQEARPPLDHWPGSRSRYVKSAGVQSSWIVRTERRAAGGSWAGVEARTAVAGL